MKDTNENTKSIRKKATEMDIVEFLEKIGVTPEYIIKDDVFYCIPHYELKPNIKVNNSDNTYIDLITKSKGTLEKLVKRIYSYSKSDAITLIQKTKNLISPLVTDYRTKPYYVFLSDEYHLISESTIGYIFPVSMDLFSFIHDMTLLKYIWKSKLNQEIVNSYCQEVECIAIRIGRFYKDITFRNDSKGCVLFNSTFYGNKMPVDVRTIKGTSGTLEKLTVFFRPVDFLSYLTLKETIIPENDVIVVNAESKIIDAILSSLDYSTIDLYLGNDEKKRFLSDFFIIHNPNAINKSLLEFPSQQNFNDYLKRITK